MIAQQLRNGDPGAMRDFYNLYGTYLTAVCARYIDNDEDVADVFHDALIKIFSNIGKFEYRGEGTLKSWAARVMVNAAVDFLKHKRRITMVDADCLAETEAEEAPDTGSIPPEAIHAMVRRLPDGYRAVFNLYVVENKSHKEIAEILGIKADSSASQLHRAKALLAKEIKRYKNNNGQ